MLATDISYGLITTLYLSMMSLMAWIVASRFDAGGRDARGIHSDVRRYILMQLNSWTDGARGGSPFLDTILRQAEDNVEAIILDGPQSNSSKLSYAHKVASARECINQLQTEFGHLHPVIRTEPVFTRPSPPLVTLGAFFRGKSSSTSKTKAKPAA
jgi:hypothetical protein